MKKRISTIILILVFLLGLSLLLYPTISNYWNERHQSKAIASYVHDVENLSQLKRGKLLQDATDYNRYISTLGNQWHVTDEHRAKYLKQLDISGNGIMGYIEIPQISCSLPIYHGTDESVLQIAVGHLEGTSLPVGGNSSHCVLSGHRGLPSANLFTDIDQLVPGDTFTLNVLDLTLTYEVFEILTVLPQDVTSLRIETNKDLCTLVTCTPYGINTHRLLVRARRIENPEEETTVRVTSDALQIEPVIVAPIIAVPMLLVLFVVLILHPKKKK